MKSKQAECPSECPSCQKDTTIHQITETKITPNGSTFEFWCCDDCANRMYDGFLETFGS